MDIEFFAAGEGVTFTVYVVLQLLAAIAVRGRYRMLVWIPAPFMIGVLLWTIYSYRSGGNLWPIVMIFASPVAIVAVIVLWVALRVVQKREAAAPTR